ncbi:YajQ family cyclic di-GMP-binding protein [Alkalilimnicola sp. S0819]|uniref:YajQ family cyclic di-GMP-binding protein n=1 Tax=Alkalilimnicola sp. S0819 TaxID=2613922 RepID=UPI0012627557|nr:YajQ family cyclic di-GMP-binding protein [Alkalilimnicola sp. S0819]KAB7622576.1 YajQ family cyclic di-GMP-binding protein [Alkalilimnicola sp. S0819]MPQ17464.1 YajQ family cyclic di-GMP-binding protein [Alkalilimnicola sp. S0819]
MPSFDVVSEVDMHEVSNAVDQANREVSTRFDFKGTDSSFSLEGERITLVSESEFQLQQMMDVLYAKLARRGVDVAAVEPGEPEQSGKQARQSVSLRQGIDQDMGKKISKLIKQSKLKVQSQIQGDKLRVTGKKRDDLQAVMALLRGEELELPLQFNNFRD